jgi:hypothetical protein
MMIGAAFILGSIFSFAHAAVQKDFSAASGLAWLAGGVVFSLPILALPVAPGVLLSLLIHSVWNRIAFSREISLLKKYRAVKNQRLDAADILPATRKILGNLENRYLENVQIQKQSDQRLQTLQAMRLLQNSILLGQTADGAGRRPQALSLDDKNLARYLPYASADEMAQLRSRVVSLSQVPSFADAEGPRTLQVLTFELTRDQKTLSDLQVDRFAHALKSGVPFHFTVVAPPASGWTAKTVAAQISQKLESRGAAPSQRQRLILNEFIDREGFFEETDPTAGAIYRLNQSYIRAALSFSENPRLCVEAVTQNEILSITEQILRLIVQISRTQGIEAISESLRQNAVLSTHA